MDTGLIVLLILLNGVFAMSEMAVVSARQARLHKLADRGRPGAKAALNLHQKPSNFLSTIQVGITTVSILSGALGMANLKKANLSQASLKNANLRGALLKGTVWTDGRTCAAGSVGRCK